MEVLFLKLLNMSITASWLVLVVAFLRLVLKKAPKAIFCFLWALVALRLLCPFSFESVLSLIPSAETIPKEIVTSEAPAINSGIYALNSAVNPVISKALAPDAVQGTNPVQRISAVASAVWIAGVILMILYALISYIRLHRKTREGIELVRGVWLCDHIDSSFILGVIHPRIFLPSSITETDRKYVIAHEKAHLKRLDYIWKPLGFTLLTVYWFNPVIWLAYILLCRDIELACDEKVIGKMSAGDKKSYSKALVNCSVPQRMVSACPLAFGEAGIKGRIKNVLNYKKPAFWIIAAAVIVCIAVSLCFLTNPQKEGSPSVTVEIPTEVQYKVAGLLYNNGSFSYVEDEENAPQYYLYHEKLMWNQSVREESARQVWGVIGDLQSIDLTEENFDALFRNMEIWQENYTPELIRKSTASAKRTESEEGFFYILYQKNTDVLLCRGFYMNDGAPFIRWVDKLEAVTNQDTNSSFSAPWQGDMLSAPDSNIQFDSLRDKYPQYYDLNTENGLAVYVCKMGENSYRCGLLPGTDRDRKYDEILRLAPASLEEMKEILNSYDIPNENIVFIPFQNPLSSYAWVVMEEGETYEEWLKTESNYLRKLVGRPIGD